MASPGVREERTLLVGTAANVAGLLVGVAAAFGVQILLGRTLAPGGFGLVTVAVQVAFVASAGSRFGMDMASVRLVAIGRGADASSHLRSLVDRCALVALGASLLVAAVLAASSPLFGDYARVIALAAAGVPFIALTNVYLGATRGLAQMRQTLYVFWIGQPLLWIALAALSGGGRRRSGLRRPGLRRLLARRTPSPPGRSGEERRAPSTTGRRRGKRSSAALRYGLPRAPSALLAQAIFWVDLWVLAALEQGTDVDAYAAAARVSQVLLLFLTSLNLVFSPFAADLHARGHRERLDELFKRSTRWALAATLPLLIVLFVAAGDVLHAFSPRFEVGEGALRILLVGQAANVATGSVGFILIMTGFTGLDLLDNALGVALLAGLAAALTRGLRDRGDRDRCGRQHRGGQRRAARRRCGVGSASSPTIAPTSGLLASAAAGVLAAFGAHAALAGSPGGCRSPPPRFAVSPAIAPCFPSCSRATSERRSPRPSGESPDNGRRAGCRPMP